MRCPKKHVFVCVNNRSDISRKSCGKIGLSIRTELVRYVHENGLDEDVRINKSGCLNACELGPTLVIYPNKIWYKKVQIDNVEEIIEKSIKNDLSIDSLAINEKDWEKI